MATLGYSAADLRGWAESGLDPHATAGEVVEAFFRHVQEYGFVGYTPGVGDVLADAWARKVRTEYDRVSGTVPPEEERVVWPLFQWLYCELAGQRSRVIASPPALRAAGLEVAARHVWTACRLLLRSTEE